MTAAARASAADATPLVALARVDKTYSNGVTALRDFTLAVEPGETLTLLGPSGCGKSTALRLMAGLEAPSNGAIRSAATAPRVSVVFQEPTLLPWASVFDNVFLPLRLLGASRAAAAPQVAEALARVGLSDVANARPRELSGGMKMRCAIARALVTRPALLLMDEPFAALDEVTRFRLNDELLTLKRDLGATIVFVTHSVYEAAYLSTRIVVMSRAQGAIVDDIAVGDAPRGPAFRHSEAFTAITRRASAALREAMGETA